MIEEEEEIKYAYVHRALGDPVYRFRHFGLLLKDADFFFIIMAGMLSGAAVSLFGLGTFGYRLITLDPFGWISIMVIAAYAISIMHSIRPEGNIEEVIRHFGLPKLYAARRPGGDHKWKSHREARRVLVTRKVNGLKSF